MRRLILLSVLLPLAACGSREQDQSKTTAPTAAATSAETGDVPATEGIDALDTGRKSTTPHEGPSRPTATAPKWQEMVVATEQGGYRLGNPDADVKIVEYGARTCPSCGEFGRTALEPLTRKYISTGRVSYEFRDFAVHGIPDIAAALVGQCGGASAFFPILDATYRRQAESLAALGGITGDEQKALEGKKPAEVLAFLATKGGYVEIARQAGLPSGRAEACLADMKAAQRLMDITNNAKDIDSTPTFLINGRKSSSHNWAGIEAELRKAGA